MTKRRVTLSRHDAVAYAIAMLGEAGIRAATGKSLSMAYAWANPDDEREISLIDAARLAAALTGGGHDNRFSAAFAVETGLLSACDASRSSPLEVRAQLIRLAAEFGDLAGAVQEATRDSSLDQDEIARLLREANEVRAVAEEIIRGLRAPLRAVAGNDR